MNYKCAFLELLKDGVISIRFYRNGATIRVEKQDLYNEYFEYDEEVINEFVSQGFEIINDVKEYILGDMDSINEEDESLIKEIIEGNSAYVEDILVKENSNLNLLNSIEYEVLTKRDKKSINKVLAYSLLINFNISEIKNREDEDKTVSLELSKEDIKMLINKLGQALESIEMIDI